MMKLRRSSRCDRFESNFERDIKRIFQIDSFTDEIYSIFGKFAIKCKVEQRIILSFASGTQNIWCVTYSFYCRG